MAAGTGVAPLVNYAGLASDSARVQALMDLIPDIDTLSSSGAQAGGGFLDEMSPGASVQLRVELAALKAAVS